MEKIILSKFAMLIESLRKPVNCELVSAHAVESNYEVIAILPSDLLSDFAHHAHIINNPGGISDMEMHVEVLDAYEHNFKVKITCKSK